MTNKKNRVYIYDSTLRDGAQTSTINFGLSDKITISQKLDELGFDYIEGGWPGANPTDDEFFKKLPKLKNSKFSAFGMTHRRDLSADEDPGLNAIINSNTDTVCIVGKSWDFHLTHALHISKEENLQMIENSIKYIVENNKEAVFDAEHFFDGFKSNKKFALDVIKCALKAGARWIILCDTNGGSLPSEIKEIIKQVIKEIPGENLGIHCHDDTGQAVANSIAAVEAGVRQVQGSINGIGERCGNANLTSIIPTLILKMGFDVGINDTQLKNLKSVSHYLDDLIGHERNDFAPYVGKYAFAHKGGLHVSAVTKNPECYEHTKPERLGNKRFIVVSDQAGRSNIIDRLKEINIDFDDKKISSHITNLVKEVKSLEAKGYSYDVADASFAILAHKILFNTKDLFSLVNFDTTNDVEYLGENKIKSSSKASIKIKIDNKTFFSESTGNGPVNALDLALRKILSTKYPQLKEIHLSDYKVRIVNPSDGTKAITRVLIEFGDKNGNKWTTIGVSQNIVYASFEALKDGITYKLLKVDGK